MAKGTSLQDPSLLEAALEGLELQKQRIEEQIEKVRQLIGHGGRRSGRTAVRGTASDSKPVKKRNLSAAARKRIAAAQKKRWAQFRKNSAVATE